MAEWPSSVPDPLMKGASGVLGSNLLARETQAGRRDVTRWGSGAPDEWKFTIRIVNENLSAFETFWNTTLNMGINWFSALWISGVLGYSDHKGKIVGYPKLKAKGKLYRDYTISILVKPAANCPADTTWPTWS